MYYEFYLRRIRYVVVYIISYAIFPFVKRAQPFHKEVVGMRRKTISNRRDADGSHAQRGRRIRAGAGINKIELSTVTLLHVYIW